jgi:uncharacterized protein YbbC (DUF1343 family)
MQHLPLLLLRLFVKLWLKNVVLVCVKGTLNRVKGTLNRVKGTLNRVKGTLNRVKGVGLIMNAAGMNASLLKHSAAVMNANQSEI